MKKQNKIISIVILIAIILLTAVIYFKFTKVENIEKGIYYNENETLLGKCEKWVVYETGNSGPGVTYENFYDDNDKLIGKCWRYQGPGSSGGAGVGCDSDKLQKESFEGECAEIRENLRPSYCRLLPIYSCIID